MSKPKVFDPTKPAKRLKPLDELSDFAIGARIERIFAKLPAGRSVRILTMLLDQQRDRFGAVTTGKRSFAVGEHVPAGTTLGQNSGGPYVPGPYAGERTL